MYCKLFLYEDFVDMNVWEKFNVFGLCNEYNIKN